MSMYSYIKGIVAKLNSDHIILENQGIGYMVYVANPYSFSLNQEMVVYLYQHIREDAHLLFGFKSNDEKDLFLRLILVKGIGPKIALGVLSTAEVDKIILAIEDGNISYLKKIPGIGPKAAQQIILDLKGKLVFNSKTILNQAMEEAKEVLIALGYKTKEIDTIFKGIEGDLDTNEYVKKALSLLVK